MRLKTSKTRGEVQEVPRAADPDGCLCRHFRGLKPWRSTPKSIESHRKTIDFRARKAPFRSRSSRPLHLPCCGASCSPKRTGSSYGSTCRRGACTSAPSSPTGSRIDGFPPVLLADGLKSTQNDPKWLDFQAVWPVNVAFSWPRGAEGYLPAGVSHRMEPRSPEADREVR